MTERAIACFCVLLREATAFERNHRLVSGLPNIPTVMCDDQADQPIKQGRAEHQRDKPRLGPPIKRVTENYQDKVTPPLGRARERIIHQERER